MVNNNGSNNGTHEAAAVAARNGNGHRPAAAIPGEHDLLWDGLPPAVIEKLGQPLDPVLVSQRKGRKGQVYDYLEGHVVIDQANRIFGYGGWGYDLVGDVTLRRIEAIDGKTGEVKVSLAYSAPVRVTVAGALPRTDIGFHAVTDETPDDHDTAIKAAVTDGMKRALRSFGVQFGNGFYGDQQPVGAQAGPTPAPAQANGKPSQAQTNGKPDQAQTNGDRRKDAQVEKLRKRLFEIAAEMGIGEDGVRSAVVERTEKDIDDLTAAELGPLVEAAADKLREKKQAKAA